MSYGHRVTSTYTCESVTRVLLLLLSCLRFLCIAGEALRPPPRPPAGHSSCREENEVDNCPSRGLVNVHADVSAYQRAKSDGGAAAAVTCPCLISVAAWRRRARPDAPSRLPELLRQPQILLESKPLVSHPKRKCRKGRSHSTVTSRM